MKEILDYIAQYVTTNRTISDYNIYVNKIPHEDTKKIVSSFRFSNESETDVNLLCGNGYSKKTMYFYLFNDIEDNEDTANEILKDVINVINGHYNFQGIGFKIIKIRLMQNNGYVGVDTTTGLGAFNASFEVTYEI